MIWLLNVFHLSLKELRCVLRDRTMMGAILISFTVAVYVVAVGAKADVTHVTIGIIDHDQSGLSQRIRAALQPPMFQTPVDLTPTTAQAAMDEGRYLFILDIPRQFEADIHGQRPTTVQLTVDATAMAQAQLGIAYITEIVLRETLSAFKVDNLDKRLPTRQVVHVLYNPNTTTSWFTSVMQLINNVTVLSVVLVGAAVIRERERGTIEHLLVMPVTPLEIMLAKVWAMGLVVLVASGAALVGVIQGFLAVPINGSLPLFLAGTALHLFACTALGIVMATVARSMPQFGLLLVLILLPLQMLSGGQTPRENMPQLVQQVMMLAPTTHYVALAQAILFRGAGFDVVWPQFAALLALGGGAFAYAAARFRRTIASMS